MQDYRCRVEKRVVIHLVLQTRVYKNAVLVLHFPVQGRDLLENNRTLMYVFLQICVYVLKRYLVLHSSVPGRAQQGFKEFSPANTCL
jgi:hypothetical protein